MENKVYLCNTLTRKVENLIPNVDGKINMYTCGPTVYHFAHIGNLRCYIMEDILEKTLRYVGYDVKRVMNITDVGHLSSDADTGEDKMLKGAKRENKTVMEIAKFYTDAFFADCEKLNIKRPDVVEPATNCIDNFIEMVEKLLEKGYAYVAGGNVYFDTAKLKEYYVFSADDYKTGDTTEGIAAYICSSKLAPTVDAYYNASYPAKIASKLDATSILFESNPKTVYYTTYQLISDALSILSGSSSDEFARLAVGTYLRGSDSPYYPVISFMFEHALDLTFSLNLRELLEALPQIIALQKAVENGGKPDTFEMVCSHTPSSYLAWMMAAETPDQLSAQAVKQLQWMDVSADGSNIFCSANLSKSGTYWLAVYDKNGRMLQCLPLGSGLLAETNTVSGAGTAKLFLLNDAHAPMVGSVSSR